MNEMKKLAGSLSGVNRVLRVLFDEYTPEMIRLVERGENGMFQVRLADGRHVLATVQPGGKVKLLETEVMA